MDNAYYINLTTDVLTSDLNFGYLRKAEEFSLRQIGDAIYITAPWREDDPERGKWPRFKRHFKKESILPDDYQKLLLSTIGLVEKPKRWDWGAFQFCDLDWQKSFGSLIPFERVGQWLTDYGLPSFDNELHQKGYWGYSLRDFKIHVATIFLIYETYTAIMEGDNPEQLALYLTDQPFLLWNSGTAPDMAAYYKKADFQRKILNGGKENAKQSAHFLIGVILDHQMKNVTLNYSFADSRFYWQAISLFDVCYYQLAHMTTLDLGEYGEHKRHIKKCRNCGGLFWGHGNKLYCDHCDRRTIWKRKQRGGAENE
jgi:hypothetical protein